MAALTEWKVPSANQPRAGDYAFDLDKALSSVVGLHSIIPADAHSAETLGTERAGNGVVIDDGLVLTIGYLITEAETVWLHRGDGRVVEGHALGFDFRVRLRPGAGTRRPRSRAAAARLFRCRRGRRPRGGRRRTAGAAAAPADRAERNPPGSGNICWTRQSSTPFRASRNCGIRRRPDLDTAADNDQHRSLSSSNADAAGAST